MTTAEDFWASARSNGQVDDLDDIESGWSVLAVGVPHRSSKEEFASLRYGQIPEPCAAGPRTLFVSLAPLQLSGRRPIPTRL